MSRRNKRRSFNIIPIIIILLAGAIVFTAVAAFPLDMLGKVLPQPMVSKVEEIRGFLNGKTPEEVHDPPSAVEKRTGTAVYGNTAADAPDAENTVSPDAGNTYGDDPSASVTERIKRALDACETTIVLENVSADEIKAAMNDIYREPEYFWINREYQTTVSGDGKRAELKVSSDYEDIELARRQIEEAAAQIMANVPADGSDYRKTRAVYEEMVNRISYNYGEPRISDGSIYGALVEGSCVCEGYSKTFVYLMEKAGLKAEMYSGTAVANDGSTESHAWNSAYLNGELYYFDVTWGDQDNGIMYYDWFAVTSEQIRRTHFPDEAAPMPETSATACNYYYLNDLVLYSPDELSGKIAAQGYEADLMCADENIFNEVCARLDDVNVMAGICSDAGLYVSGYSYSLNYSLYTLKILFQ